MFKTCVSAALLVLSLSGSASALPFSTLPAPASGDRGIILVYGGCGPFGHRGPYGGCRPGGQAGGYIPGRACPRGFHIGRGGRRCWPNRY